MKKEYLEECGALSEETAVRLSEEDEIAGENEGLQEIFLQTLIIFRVYMFNCDGTTAAY